MIKGDLGVSGLSTKDGKMRVCNEDIKARPQRYTEWWVERMTVFWGELTRFGMSVRLPHAEFK